MKKIEQFLVEWGDRAPGKEKTGHVVVVLGATAPTVVHDTIETAEKEAERLIGTLPATVNQTALVLTITSAVTRMKQHVPPIEVVRLAATSPPLASGGTLPASRGYLVGEPGPIMFAPASEGMSFLPAKIAAAHAGAASPVPLPDGFIPWAGGERPVSGETIVSLVCRGGLREEKVRADNIVWRHGFDKWDIIGFKVEKPEDFAIESGKVYITGELEIVGPMAPHSWTTEQWFHAANDTKGRLWNSKGLRAIRKDARGDIIALAADQSPKEESHALDAAFYAASAFTAHERAALEEQAGREIDWSKVESSDGTHPTPPAPAPKFKPGDRVYFDYTDERVYGTVCEPKIASARDCEVWANWDHPVLEGGPHWMSADRVFPDLRTVAGGGVLKLEYGRKGKTRDGQIVGPFNKPPNGHFDGRWAFQANGSSPHDEDGRFTSIGKHPRDIVELLPEGA